MDFGSTLTSFERLGKALQLDQQTNLVIVEAFNTIFVE
jgi:hypothetical protein